MWRLGMPVRGSFMARATAHLRTAQPAVLKNPLMMPVRQHTLSTIAVRALISLGYDPGGADAALAYNNRTVG